MPGSPIRCAGGGASDDSARDGTGRSLRVGRPRPAGPSASAARWRSTTGRSGGGGRLTRFYEQFLSPGDLAFDLGAHVGNRVRVFRRLGARVVAVEPQPDLVTVLRLLYGRDPAVRLESCGVAATTGTSTLHLSSRTPTVSSFAGSWIDEVSTDPGFRRVRWDQALPMRMTTLDELIARHGEPQFCKIDVEGFEHEVLSGLSRPLRVAVVRVPPDRRRASGRLRGAAGRPRGLPVPPVPGGDASVVGPALAGRRRP